MDENKIIETGKLTDAEIETLKKVHGEVNEISVAVNDDETEIAYCYIKKPTRNVLELVFGLINTNPYKAAILMLQNCWLAGDNRIKEDDDVTVSAIGPVLGRIKIRHGEIKKK